MCGKIWDKFEMKNLGDYHNHYFKKDVLLLADAFQKFIATCLKFYGTDPCHYFSYAELSLNAIFKLTGVKLGKISDNDRYLFIEKVFRERISYNAKRYAKANNKYLNTYDPKKTFNIYITLDMNNLYCLAMSEYLLYERFKWLKNIDEFDVMSVSEKSLAASFLQVHLEYSDQLHELRNDYPLGPEKNLLFLVIYCRNIVRNC